MYHVIISIGWPNSDSEGLKAAAAHTKRKPHKDTATQRHSDVYWPRTLDASHT
jgi:hypothetical protein